MSADKKTKKRGSRLDILTFHPDSKDMSLMTAKITSKGQVTLPKQLRNFLGVHEGDRIEFSLTDSGQAGIRRMNASGSSTGSLKHLGKKRPVSVEAMDIAIARRAKGRFSK